MLLIFLSLLIFLIGLTFRPDTSIFYSRVGIMIGTAFLVAGLWRLLAYHLTENHPLGSAFTILLAIIFTDVNNQGTSNDAPDNKGLFFYSFNFFLHNGDIFYIDPSLFDAGALEMYVMCLTSIIFIVFVGIMLTNVKHKLNTTNKHTLIHKPSNKPRHDEFIRLYLNKMGDNYLLTTNKPQYNSKRGMGSIMIFNPLDYSEGPMGLTGGILIPKDEITIDSTRKRVLPAHFVPLDLLIVSGDSNILKYGSTGGISTHAKSPYEAINWSNLHSR